MSPVPLKQIPLGPELLGFRVLVAIEDHRYLATMRGFEQTGDLLQVDAGRADVILQPEIVPLATLRQQALFDDDVRDDPVGGRLALGLAVRVLDDVDADRLDE